MPLQYFNKEVRDGVDCSHANKHQSFLQVNFNIMGIKFSYQVTLSLVMVMIKYSQSTQSDKFVISLEYLEKEVRNGVHFLHAGKQQSFYNLALMFLIQVARYVQSTKNRTLIIFFQYIKKKVSKLLFRSIVMLWGPVMFVIACCLNHDILIGRYSVHCDDKNYLLVIILHQALKRCTA